MSEIEEDKICPFMSRPVIGEIRDHGRRSGCWSATSDFHTVHCLKEHCAAWGAVAGTLGYPVYNCILIYGRFE